MKPFAGLHSNGRICFLSTTFDGSLSHEYINSSLPLRQNLYHGDTVVALREFPWIGIEVVPAKSPTIRKPVRIYAENVLNRIKGYKILSDCPYKLLTYSKEIAHIIAVIININTNVFIKRKFELQEASKLKVEIDNDHAYLNPTDSTSQESLSSKRMSMMHTYSYEAAPPKAPPKASLQQPPAPFTPNFSNCKTYSKKQKVIENYK